MGVTSKFTATVPRITSAHRIHSQGQASLWFVRCCPGNHSDAVDNRADGETQGTACASVSNGGQVGFGIKLDSLVARVITGHVAFATVDTHFFIDHSHNLLYVAQFTKRSKVLQCFSNYILNSRNRLLGIKGFLSSGGKAAFCSFSLIFSSAMIFLRCSR